MKEFKMNKAEMKKILKAPFSEIIKAIKDKDVKKFYTKTNRHFFSIKPQVQKLEVFFLVKSFPEKPIFYTW